uniref:Uncharacterized protein n=1 Tax=Acrobeloides nanus TaxID=290746 RepID=A0A914CR19_9BILA
MFSKELLIVLGLFVGSCHSGLVDGVLAAIDCTLVGFLNFVTEFNPNYANQAEHDYRFSIFQQNCAELKQIIQSYQGSSCTFGFTKFMDRTKEEKARMTGGLMNPVNTPAPASSTRTKRQSQAYFDWRNSNNVSPVRDQGNCGSCWAFGSTAAVESQLLIHNHSNYVGLLGLYMNYPDQSEQELVSCVSGSNCGGGNVNAALNYIKNNGQDTESSYPYATSNSACNPVASGKTKIISYWNVGTSEVNIANQLLSTGPLILGLWLPPSFWYYKSGVYQPNAGDCVAGTNGHVMAVVGYNVTSGGTPYWIVKNSWGTSFGQSGYINWYFGNWFSGCIQFQGMTAVSTV